MSLADNVVGVNTLGRENLLSKGKPMPEDSTTYDIMQAILDITGGGADYRQITYAVVNKEHIVSLLEANGINQHEIRCKYDDDTGALKSLSYDDKSVGVRWSMDKTLLRGVDGTAINLKNAPYTGFKSVYIPDIAAVCSFNKADILPEQTRSAPLSKPMSQQLDYTAVVPTISVSITKN